MPMKEDMKRAIGVMAVLAVVILAAALLDDGSVLTGNGCPADTDRWATVGVDFAGDEVGFATKADAVRAWFRESNLNASNESILRAIDRSEREGDASIMVETTEGLPAILSVETVNDGWFVKGADWCRLRTPADHAEV
jgi:hypothetical protein